MFWVLKEAIGKINNSVSWKSSSHVCHCYPYTHYHYCKSGGNYQQTQLFAGILCEPYQPVIHYTKPNEYRRLIFFESKFFA